MTAENTLKVCQSLLRSQEDHELSPVPTAAICPNPSTRTRLPCFAAVARNFPAAAPPAPRPIRSSRARPQRQEGDGAPRQRARRQHDRSATLTREEADIYRLIVRRYIAQFFPGARVRRNRGRARNRRRDLHRQGGASCASKAASSSRRTAGPPRKERRKNPKAAGGRDPDAEDEDDAQTLPHSRKGDVCDVRAVKGREDKTKPPQFFTEGTLIAAMENIWRSFDDPKGQAMLKEAGGIGTPATRARPSSPNSSARNTSRPKASTCTVPNLAAGSSSGFRPASARPP